MMKIQELSTPGGLEVGTITVEVTHRCPRQCAFCYLPSTPSVDAQGPSEIPAAQLVGAVGALARKTGCGHVQLSGGEPLVREDLIEIVADLREQGIRVSMITDGGPLDQQLARQLAARQLSLIQPTLLAGEAGPHDELRGRGSFAEATRGIATAAAAGIHVTICLVVTRHNWREAERVAELAFALGARGLALSRFCPAGAAAGAYAELMPRAEQVRGACRAAARRCRELGLPLFSVITIPRCMWGDSEQPPLRVGVCALMGPRAPITVGPDGEVRSCSLSSTSVGNLLREPWDVLAARLWQQHIKPPRHEIPQRCSGCRHWPRCQGGCRLSAKAVFGSFSHPDPLAAATKWPTAALAL